MEEEMQDDQPVYHDIDKDTEEGKMGETEEKEPSSAMEE